MNTVRAELVEAQPFDKLRANGVADKAGRINKRLLTASLSPFNNPAMSSLHQNPVQYRRRAPVVMRLRAWRMRAGSGPGD
jgi:hypothetical protein